MNENQLRYADYCINEVYNTSLPHSATLKMKMDYSSYDELVIVINILIEDNWYTNTVGVSAVRDLFGTVMNEGANKGILVTTSDYGADSYEFAKGKPITLLNGANLLYLLEKHGTRAKIDIKEARRLMNEER